MKNRKVLNLRTHLGGLYGKTSYDAAKDRADMDLWPVGVYIKSINGNPANLLVWASNIVECHLAPEEEVVAQDDKPRGPGRPPGPKAA